MRPISSVPANPPLPEAWFSRVNTDDGMVISNAPSRLSEKTTNSAAMKPLTHGLAPSCTTPTGPSTAVITRPSPENSTMIPRQKTTACRIASRRPPDCRLRKYDMVMGIIGKQHGVKMEATPKPKAARRKRDQLCAGAAGLCPGGAGAGSFTRAKPTGGTGVEGVTAGSIVILAVPDHLPGTQVLSLQVWKRAAISTVVAPAGASGRVLTNSAKAAEPSNVSVSLLKLGSNARLGEI